jgi:hypothetical protein
LNRLGLILCLVLAALAAVAAPSIAAPTGAPSATTGKATNVTPSGATVTGSVNPHGHPTSYYFQFGKTTSYGTRTNTGDAGAGTVSTAVSATLGGLQPNTTYHYQLVAFSPAGTTRGSDRTFKTPQIPTTSTINVGPNPVVFGGLATITGFLTGPDVGGKQVALQANVFPFTGGFQQLGNTVLTTPQGGYTFLVTPVLNAQMRVVDKSMPSVSSPVVVENVALRSTFSAHRSHRRFGRVKFSGRVYPAKAGNAVLIQRLTSHGWTNAGLTLTKPKTPSYSGFARTLKLRKGGNFRVLVKTAGGDYVDGTSRTVRVRLR